jgi:hypothetical protein
MSQRRIGSWSGQARLEFANPPANMVKRRVADEILQNRLTNIKHENLSTPITQLDDLGFALTARSEQIFQKFLEADK